MKIEQIKRKVFKHYYRTRYINERMITFAQNIDLFQIGQTILDSDKSKCKITNKTINSIEVFISKKFDNGINCKQWFDMTSFNKRFTL